MKYLILFSFLFSLFISCSLPKKTTNDNLGLIKDTCVLPPMCDDPINKDNNIVDSTNDLVNRDNNIVDEPPIEVNENISVGSGMPSREEIINIKSTNNSRHKKLSNHSNNISNNESGRLIYDIPDTMIILKTYYVIIRINRNIDDRNIYSNIDNNGDTVIRTSSKMEVDLIDISDGKNFSIVKNNSNQQLVDSDDYTEWVFNVTPTKIGKLKLNLVVSIIRNNTKKQVVYIENIYVRSNPKGQLKSFWDNNWQWTLGSIVIPLIVWIYNRKKRRKTKRK